MKKKPLWLYSVNGPDFIVFAFTSYETLDNIFFLSKLSTIYIPANRTIKNIYIIYICNAYIHAHICICSFAYIYIHTYIHTYTHIGIRLDDTKTAPYCFFINSKAKKLTKIH